MITQRYNLNLIPDKVPVIVNCSQYDALSRTIEMVIFDGSTVYDIPSGTSASVRGTKQDNTGFEYPCTIDGSVVSFDIQNQMTIFAGRVPCEIRLSNNGGIIGTCNFLLNVEETPLDPDVTISETVLPLLEEAEQNAARAEAAADEAEAVLSTAVKSVNDTLPDANGNVDVVALPTGGTADQVLVKQSSTDGDADWETAGMWHGDEVGSLPVPINADQLQGHPASYFQPLLTAGEGIDITNQVISNSYFYNAGDIFYCDFNIFSAYISSSTTTISAQIILDKPLSSSVTTFTLTQLMGTMRGISGYIDSITSNTDLLPLYTCTLTKKTANILELVIQKSSTMTNVTNNTPVSIRVRISISFS